MMEINLIYNLHKFKKMMKDDIIETKIIERYLINDLILRLHFYSISEKLV